MNPARLVSGMACVIVATLTAVAGCGLPSSSSVRQGLAVDAPGAPPIQLKFEAPRVGSSPAQIVTGFLAAQWSSDDGYRSARSYMSADTSAVWRPRNVVVYADNARPTTKVADDGETVTVSVPEVGTVDAQGRYSASPVGTVREVDLALEKINGEWRISGLPDDFGLWLSQFYFDRAYREFQVSYVSRIGAVMVPDWRRFAAGPGVPTTLARAMLDPIPAYLSQTVQTGFLPGTSLALDSVAITNGTAQVDLSSRALAMDPQSRRAAWAQALRTMRQTTGATDVMLLVDGSPLDVGGLEGTPRTIAELGFSGAPDRAAVVLRRVGDRFVPVSSTSFPMSVDAPQLPKLPVVPTTWPRVAASLNLRDVVAVSADGGAVGRWVEGTRVRAVVPGSGFTSPSFDRFGRAWVAGVAPGGAPTLWSLPAAGSAGSAQPHANAVAVRAPWLAGRRVLDVRPSPEGARMVVLSQGKGGRTHLDLAGIVRDESGVPTSLDTALPVGGDIAKASSVLWVDDRTLAVVGSRLTNGVPTPLIVPLAAGTVEFAPVPGLTSLVSLGDESGLVAVTSANEIVRSNGWGWQDVGSATDIIVPGR